MGDMSEDVDSPSPEDLARDLRVDLHRCEHFHRRAEAARRDRQGRDPSSTGGPEFFTEVPFIAEAALRRAIAAEAELERLRGK